jgi:hypothetical protein
MLEQIEKPSQVSMLKRFPIPYLYILFPDKSKTKIQNKNNNDTIFQERASRH